jgi:hypothetical protein
MKTILLSHPLIQFYLLFVAALAVALVRDRYLRSRPAVPTPRLPLPAANENQPRWMWRSGRRTAVRRLQTATAFVPAPSSRNRRKHHVVTA